MIPHEWLGFLEAYELKPEECRLIDDGLLWIGGLWFDRSYLTSQAQNERLSRFFEERNGLYGIFRDEHPDRRTLMTLSPSSRELRMFTKECRLLAKKWDLPLTKGEEVPVSEWFRLLNHIYGTEWFDFSGKMYKRATIGFDAFCPTLSGWRPVWFGSTCMMTKAEWADESTREALKKEKDKSMCLSLTCGLRSNLGERRHVGVRRNPENLSERIVFVPASRVRI